VQVGAAHAAGEHLHANFTGSGMTVG
jgi:hypothetical protein